MRVRPRPVASRARRVPDFPVCGPPQEESPEEEPDQPAVIAAE
jgi:hypothetical protein